MSITMVSNYFYIWLIEISSGIAGPSAAWAVDKFAALSS